MRWGRSSSGSGLARRSAGHSRNRSRFPESPLPQRERCGGLPARLSFVKHTAFGFWLEEAPGVEPAAALVGTHEADVVVVGGGYTGMWAAWHIKQLEPEASVGLLEAGRGGFGPSGRNGGFCNVMWFSLPNMRQRWGDAEALAVARAAEGATAAIGEVCEAE